MLFRVSYAVGVCGIYRKRDRESQHVDYTHTQVRIAEVLEALQISSDSPVILPEHLFLTIILSSKGHCCWIYTQTTSDYESSGGRKRREMGLLSNQVKRSEIVAGDHIYSWRASFIYSHHGIYIDDSLVIHFTAPPGKLTDSTKDSFSSSSGPASSSFPGHSSSSSAPGGQQKTCPHQRQRCGSRKPGSGVAISCLDCFIKKGSLYRFEYGVTEKHFRFQLRGGTCTTAESDPQSSVVQRANYLFENGFGIYHLFRNNCEDFAIYSKTGILTIDEKGPGRSGQIASLVKMFPEMGAKYFSTTKEAVKERIRKYGTDIGLRDDAIKVPVEDMDSFHRGLMPA